LLEKAERAKQSSLFCRNVIDEYEKKFYDIDT